MIAQDEVKGRKGEGGGERGGQGRKRAAKFRGKVLTFSWFCCFRTNPWEWHRQKWAMPWWEREVLFLRERVPWGRSVQIAGVVIMWTSMLNLENNGKGGGGGTVRGVCSAFASLMMVCRRRRFG